MALYTRKDFAAKCGVPVAKVNVYVSRNKITLTGKLIDDGLTENDYFYQNSIKNKSQGGHEIVEAPLAIKQEIPQPPKPTIHKEPKVKPPQESDQFRLDNLIKEADLQKKEVDTRIALLKEEKLRGEVLPVDTVKSLFSQHTKYILEEYCNSVDKIIVKIAKRKSLNNNEVAEIRSELIEEINKAVDKAVDESKKGINTVTNDFSEQRGKGERT